LDHDGRIQGYGLSDTETTCWRSIAPQTSHGPRENIVEYPILPKTPIRVVSRPVTIETLKEAHIISSSDFLVNQTAVYDHPKLM
jgi:hypothetical protein